MIPERLKSEIRGVLGTNTLFINKEEPGDLTKRITLIQKLIDKYYGRGEMYIVFNDGFNMVSEMTFGFSTENIFKLKVFNVKGRAIQPKPVEVNISCTITVEPDEERGFRETLNSVLVDENFLVAGEINYVAELEEAEAKASEEDKVQIYTGKQ